jgi:methionine synthase II (cobalamin-independent)
MQTGCLFYSKQKKIMENEIKETLERVADTVLNEPVEITVDVISPRRVWWKFWIEPVRKRVFKIQQITYEFLNYFYRLKLMKIFLHPLS